MVYAVYYISDVMHIACNFCKFNFIYNTFAIP